MIKFLMQNFSNYDFISSAVRCFVCTLNFILNLFMYMYVNALRLILLLKRLNSISLILWPTKNNHSDKIIMLNWFMSVCQTCRNKMKY